MKIDRNWLDNSASPQDVDLLSISSAGLPDKAIMLIGYQRTKQISRNSRLKWERGKPAALRREVSERRDEIFKGTLLEIYQEYLPLQKLLEASA